MAQNRQMAIHPSPLADGFLEEAILKTVLYSDCFDYPLNPEEIEFYLMGVRGDPVRVSKILSNPAPLDGKLSWSDGYLTLRGREHLADRRRGRGIASRRLWRRARLYARALSNFPFVRMVAITGALAMDNSGPGDDIDVLIVTAPDRVWLARAFTLLSVYAGKIISDTLCPNYIISQQSLSLEERSVYAAHEFAQMVPIYGGEIYRKMRAANPWVSTVLPNATHPLRIEAEYLPGRVWRLLKTAIEWLLSGKVGQKLEDWEMGRKIHKLGIRRAAAQKSVILDRSQVKGHFDDHGARVARLFHGRLQQYRITGTGEI